MLMPFQTAAVDWAGGWFPASARLRVGRQMCKSSRDGPVGVEGLAYRIISSALRCRPRTADVYQPRIYLTKSCEIILKFCRCNAQRKTSPQMERKENAKRM